MDRELLKLHQRPFRLDRFDRVVEELSQAAQTTVEIICGLPGDTPEGFKDTVRAVLDLPCSARVYHCLVLPDALMTSAPASFDMHYDPVTLEMRSCLGWSERDFAEVHDWLYQMVDDRKGEYSQKWPTPAEPGPVDKSAGNMLGSPLWVFPNHEHEEFHRLGGGGKPRLRFNSSIDVVASGGVSQSEERCFAEALATATGGAWVLETASIQQHRLNLHVLSADGAFLLIARSHEPEKPCYTSINGIDFLYRNDETSMMDNELLERAFHHIATLDSAVLKVIPSLGP